MGHMDIPADAMHWDSGDWITWHRHAVTVPELPCAAVGDSNAKLTLLQVSLLRAARNHFELTGTHLPIYDQIARVHAALQFGVPLTGGSAIQVSGVHIATLTPESDPLSVEIDMGMPFTSVLVVRIDCHFRASARMITRRTMGDKAEGFKTLQWRALPRGR